MTTHYNIPTLPLAHDVESIAILKQLALTHRRLAELKGIAHTIPNEGILISTLTLQEAKDSSAIENIITTHDDLYRSELLLPNTAFHPAAKEVQVYREAIVAGFRWVREKGGLTNNVIKQIQAILMHSESGFRDVPGTHLKDAEGRIVYTPPQDGQTVKKHMENLESFINDSDLSALDPLVKLAIIHHQFESIHPFYDGNGRTGRIINVLYLVQTGLLDLPILYLSRYITHNKRQYYTLLQAVRDKQGDNRQEWENWILFMLRAIESTAQETLLLVQKISALMAKYKERLRPLFGKQYKHELLNNLFFHPYTRVDFIAKEMQVHRLTATKYLDKMVEEGILEKQRLGRSNYYINTELFELFLSVSENSGKVLDTP